MAVVVQRVINADTAGILLTQHPTLEAPEFIAVNAVFGLAGELASGEASADTFIVDKIARTLVRQEVVEQATMLVADPVQGPARRAVPLGRRSSAALNEAQLAQLVDVAIGIETAAQRPMDVEWALAEGQLFVVQARPAGALAPEQTHEEPGGQWVFAEELYPAPCVRWDVELFQQFLDAHNARQWIWGGAAPLRAKRFGQYLYLSDVPGAAGEASETVRAGMDLVVRAAASKWRSEWRGDIESDCRTWLETEVTAASLQENWELAQHMLEVRRRHEIHGLYAGMAASFAVDLFLPALPPIDQSARQATLARVTRGLPSRADDLELALDELVAEIRHTPALGAYLRSQFASRSVSGSDRRLVLPGPLAAFLRRWGFKGVDRITSATWAESPHLLFDLLRRRLSADIEPPGRRLRRLSEERTAEIDALRPQLPAADRAVFERRLADLLECVPLNQDRYVVVVEMGYAALRHVLGEIGRKLERSGRLPRSSDIYLIGPDEIDGAVRHGRAPDRGDLTRVKRQLAAARRRTPPKTLSFQGSGPRRQARREAVEADAGVVFGTPASPGRAVGPATIARELEAARCVEPGDALIAQMTTPAWTPIFPLLSAIVTETGSLLSHPAILAREYGIPAVVGARGALALARPGDLVTVDGGRGCIEAARRVQGS